MTSVTRPETTRSHAVHIIQAVIDQHKSLNLLLKQHQQELPREQHGFLSELCYGGVRWYIKLECWLQKLMHKPLKTKDRDIHFVLILGLYQIAYVNKPLHAVLNETVNLSREFSKDWASRLINGVLRNFVRQRTALQETKEMPESLRTAMPAWLFNLLKKAYPKDYLTVIYCLNERAPMTLRVNSRRYQTSHYLNQLQQQGISARTSLVANQALTLDQPCNVEQLPGFFEGSCSVQDEAAQLVTKAFKVQPRQRLLDACCAPGGKTAALLEVFPELQILALDVDAERQQRTRDTLERLELKSEIITADAGQPELWWDGEAFDHILLDAPCSATGVIRRHPDIKHLRRQRDVKQLAKLQISLLTRLWSTLKTDGTLLYATCSILPQENTHIIGRFLSQQLDAKAAPLPVSGDIDTEYG